MAQQQPLILPLVATKGRSHPRLLSHFGVNTQLLPFSSIAFVLGPHSLPVKNFQGAVCLGKGELGSR